MNRRGFQRYDQLLLKLPCGPPWTRKAIGSLPVAVAGFSVQPQTRVVVRAGEAELLKRDRVELREQLAVDVGQLRDAGRRRRADRDRRAP